MEDYKARLQDISEIRSIMEQSTKFISLSGLSGVSAGIIALVGAYVAWDYLGGHWDYMQHAIPRYGIGFVRFFFWDAGLVLVLALGAAMFFRRKAKKLDLPVWNQSAWRLVINMAIPLAAGGIFCLIQVFHGIYMWVAASTLIFYGLALINAGKYTLKEIRYLGFLELILGLICAAWPGFGLYYWAFGFGVLHIVYGIVMYLKYER